MTTEGKAKRSSVITYGNIIPEYIKGYVDGYKYFMYNIEEEADRILEEKAALEANNDLFNQMTDKDIIKAMYHRAGYEYGVNRSIEKACEIFFLSLHVAKYNQWDENETKEYFKKMLNDSI